MADADDTGRRLLKYTRKRLPGAMLPPGSEDGVWLAAFSMPPAAITGAWAHAEAYASSSPQTIRFMRNRFLVTLIPMFILNPREVQKYRGKHLSSRKPSPFCIFRSGDAGTCDVKTGVRPRETKEKSRSDPARQVVCQQEPRGSEGQPSERSDRA